MMGRRSARWSSYEDVPIGSDPWAEMTARWRDIYDENAALARKNWLDGQSQLATAISGGGKTDPPVSATAFFGYKIDNSTHTEVFVAH
jgi:hypothetical protein